MHPALSIALIVIAALSAAVVFVQLAFHAREFACNLAFRRTPESKHPWVVVMIAGVLAWALVAGTAYGALVAFSALTG